MKNIFAFCVAFSFTLSAFAEDKTNDSKAASSKAADASAADVKAQQGVWKPIEGTIGGMVVPPEALKDITLKIDGDNYMVTIKSEGKADKGTVTLDTTTKPKRMTITGVDGPNKGKTFLASYELKDANTMRVCYDLSGKNYPKEFKSTEETSLYLVTYKRQQAVDKK